MLETMKSHTTVRKYTDEPISDDVFHQLIDAAQHAASSNFVQAYSVIQVKDEHKKAELGKLSRNEFQFETAALFGQSFALAAESMGYGICYIGGVRNNPKQISELFNLPEHVIPLFGMTVGVPVKLNEVKPRLPVEAIVHEDGYDKEKYHEQL